MNKERMNLLSFIIMILIAISIIVAIVLDLNCK